MTPPPVTDERIEKQAADIAKGRAVRDADRRLAKAQLECQRGLWKADERFLEDLRDEDTVAKIVVRDWGLTQGVCRHANSSAEARLHLVDADTLQIDVKRARMAAKTQEWTRVPP